MVLNLIRSIYDPETLMPQDDMQWDRCLDDLILFNVASQFLRVLKQSGKWNEAPPFFLERLNAEADRSLTQNWFLKRKESDLFQAFEREEIPAVPLKGIRFSEKYFGHYAGRLTGDIDVLIHRHDLDRTITCLLGNGYRFKKIVHNHAILCGEGKHPEVELHWTLDKAGWSDLSPDPFWRRSSAASPYLHIRELSTTDTFYFMCLHAVRHRVDSLKYIFDIAQMLHSAAGEIDYGELLAQAASDKTFNRIRTVLSIVYMTLPHLHRLKPLPFSVRFTTWSYPAIRDALLESKGFRYYAYRLFFKLMIFDTWKHRLVAQRKIRSRSRAEVT